MNRRIINQIQLLKSIKPSREWSGRTRDILLAQVRAQGTQELEHSSVFRTAWVYGSSGFFVFTRSMVHAVFAKPLTLASSLAVFVASVALAWSLSSESLPGEPLYAVKKTSEQVHVALVSAEGRPEVSLILADNRVRELRALAAKDDGKERQGEVGEVVDTFSGTMSDIQKGLQLTPYESKKAVEAARRMQAQAGEYEKALSETRKSNAMKNEHLAIKMSDALVRVQEAETVALMLLVDKKGSAGVSEQEIVDKLSERIKTAEYRTERLRIAASFLPDQEKMRIEGVSKDGVKALSEARELVVKGDLKAAITKLGDSKRALAAAEAVVETKEINKTTNEKDDTVPPSVPESNREKVKLIF